MAPSPPTLKMVRVQISGRFEAIWRTGGRNFSNARFIREEEHTTSDPLLIRFGKARKLWLFHLF